MQDLDDRSVDMILCDLPYGISACEWDTVIPLEPLWKQYERVIKDAGAIVLTASQPFTSALVISRPRLFKYSLVWLKSKPVGFLTVNYRPMKLHEDILIFSKGGASVGSSTPMTFNAQGVTDCDLAPHDRKGRGLSSIIRSVVPAAGQQTKTNYPMSVLDIPSEGKPTHPTQKPVALFEYLIRTYSNPGDLVLDNCSGSGTTAEACLETGRRFICIEEDARYAARSRIRLDYWRATHPHAAVAGENLGNEAGETVA
jgi:site-specific DNA-methyltransferase (adenine-specific)